MLIFCLHTFTIQLGQPQNKKQQQQNKTKTNKITMSSKSTIKKLERRLKYVPTFLLNTTEHLLHHSCVFIVEFAYVFL